MVRLALLFALLIASPAWAGDVTVHMTKDQALETLFPEADNVVELRHVLSPSEMDRIEDRIGRLDEGGFYIYVARRGAEVISHAVVVAQIGKVKPITHMVEVTTEGEVGTVAVMIYREAYGDEVCEPRFMDQYRGKSLDDAIRLDKDIINIAGATLSGHAICRGVRKSLAVVEEVVRKRAPDDLARLLAKGTDVTPASLAGGGSGGATPGQDLGAASPAPGELRAEGRLRLERRIMGTVCSIEGHHPDAARLERALDAALDEVARWDGVLSDWGDGTPLAAFNALPATVVATPDPDLRAWLADAQVWWAATGGAFDPSVGALTEAWDLRSRFPARPGPEPLRAALRATGLERLVDAPGGGLERTVEGLRLDPGASGKGWALDRAAEVLRSHGVHSALLSFRSTVLALDPPPGRDGWTVPVAHELRAFRDGDVLRGTVLDPRSGEPVPAARLAWVRHPSASASDALATALLVTGGALDAVPEASGALLPESGSPAVAWPPRP